MKVHAVAAVAAAASLAAAFMMPVPDAPAPMGRPGVIAPIETVSVAPGRFEYQVAGEFLKSGRVVEGPSVEKRFRRPVEIMKYQVSVAEYAACVADGACQPADTRAVGDMPVTIMPVTGVSHRDATAYAAWLSQRTGDDWRLPSDEEWTFAAAERFGAEANGIDAGDDGSNPAARWLAAYRSRAAPTERDAAPKPRGHFGVNANGLADLSGNVWEWTSTCFTRNRIDAAGRLAEATTNCGVRVIGGRHRGYMSGFLRDGRSGGCAAGMAPPDNLGFRLVREPAPAIGVALIRRIVGPEARG
ncbi:MAG TPA: SUMF1/EgtB/PvdO family nonheme iron enzyme [Aquamicrobium sp.]|nr:SUMF1/EgtB/PvdO family nonheme iron enzyme [Aquamicrobium sp.]